MKDLVVGEDTPSRELSRKEREEIEAQAAKAK